MEKPQKPDKRRETSSRSSRVSQRQPERSAEGGRLNAKERQQQKEERGVSRIAGLAAVSALFARAPERVERLFYDERNKLEVGAYCAILAKTARPYRLVSADELTKVAGSPMHGGVVAVARRQPITLLNVAKAQEWAKDEKTLLILDGVSNPHNFGAIARSAAFFGVPRILLSDHAAQAGLSDASYRVAEGGLEHIELFKVGLFEATLRKLQDFYHVVAAAPGDEHMVLSSLKSKGKPFALVMGNEEEGLSASTLNACQTVVSIPGVGQVQSLNVSASAAILLYALSPKG